MNLPTDLALTFAQRAHSRFNGWLQEVRRCKPLTLDLHAPSSVAVGARPPGGFLWVDPGMRYIDSTGIILTMTAAHNAWKLAATDSFTSALADDACF